MAPHNITAATIIAVLCVLMSTNTSADTAATLKYFSTEPATLLDLGIHRLEILMDAFAKHPGMQIKLATSTEVPVVTTTYNSAKNQILIQANYEFSHPSTLTQEQLKGQMEEKIMLLKFRLGVDPEEGSPLAGVSILLPAFSHQDSKGNSSIGEGLDSKNAERAQDLDRMVEISARVGVSIRCSSELRSRNIKCPRSVEKQ